MFPEMESKLNQNKLDFPVNSLHRIKLDLQCLLVTTEHIFYACVKVSVSTGLETSYLEIDNQGLIQSGQITVMMWIKMAQPSDPQPLLVNFHSIK